MDDTGDLVADIRTYTLIEVCTICGVTSQRLVGLVEFGVVLPDGDGPASWRFSETVVLRAKKALRLHRDLGLEGQGLALTLELLDEIDRLRGLVAHLHHDQTRW